MTPTVSLKTHTTAPMNRNSFILNAENKQMNQMMIRVES